MESEGTTREIWSKIKFKKIDPFKITGTNYLRPIKYFEKLGSAQCKSSAMLAAIKTPGITSIVAKNQEIIPNFFKNLNIPIKIIQKRNYDYIEIKGQSNFKGFNYKIPGDISSCSFFSVNFTFL